MKKFRFSEKMFGDEPVWRQVWADSKEEVRKEYESKGYDVDEVELVD